MNDLHPQPQPKPFFGPQDLLLNAVACHVFAILFLFPFAVMALLMSPPHQLGAAGGIGLFVWAWQSRRWVHSILFLLFTIGFWLAVMLPWRGYIQ